MTSNSVKPDTVSVPAKPESFRSHLPAIAAATAGTVLATVLGSLIGVAGTLVGIVVGSLLSGTISWWAERGLRRSAAVAAARAEAIRARGRPLRPHEDAAVAEAAMAAEDAAVVGDAEATGDARDPAASPARSRRRRRWAGPAAFVIAAFIGCAVPLTLLEHAVGKPLAAVVQGVPGNGSTLFGGVSGTSASHSPSPSPSATTTGSATAPASGTTPSGASSSPAASATGPGATASGSTSSSATPTASASPSPG
jgi:hypothetical protein